MEGAIIGRLPDELLESIVFYLSARDTVAFGFVCHRCNKITHEPLIWRRLCLERWRHWAPHHDIAEKTILPPAQMKWRKLYQQRNKVDEDALETFNKLLLTQQYRITRIEQLSAIGYDAKDLLLQQERATPENAAEDVLARRYHAKLIRAKIHREVAITKWIKLHNRGMVSVEEALGSFDLFALGGENGDLDKLSARFDMLAEQVRSSTADFDELSTRKKAIRVATVLHQEHMLGTDMEGGYHALGNNFIIKAVMEEPHRSLPLQSAAIYCAVARRLAIEAKPANFPSHVFVIVQATRGETCDGARAASEDGERDAMYMDPWRNDEEVSRFSLSIMLTQMGVPTHAHDQFLGAATTAEIALRCSRNIDTSIVTHRNSRTWLHATTRQDTHMALNISGMTYSALWATVLLANAGSEEQRSYVPSLIEHQQEHFPEDFYLIDRYITPMLVHTPEHPALLKLLAVQKRRDDNKRAPTVRAAAAAHVTYKVGDYFIHKRYSYTGAVIGWSEQCEAGENWIRQMRISELPNGRRQPFYHVLADDGSTRYVAQENIELLTDVPPNESLISIAGKYFKRFDAKSMRFVSNITEEYPDD